MLDLSAGPAHELVEPVQPPWGETVPLEGPSALDECGGRVSRFEIGDVVEQVEVFVPEFEFQLLPCFPWSEEVFCCFRDGANAEGEDRVAVVLVPVKDFFFSGFVVILGYAYRVYLQKCKLALQSPTNSKYSYPSVCRTIVTNKAFMKSFAFVSMGRGLLAYPMTNSPIGLFLKNFHNLNPNSFGICFRTRQEEVVEHDDV